MYKFTRVVKTAKRADKYKTKVASAAHHVEDYRKTVAAASDAASNAARDASELLDPSLKKKREARERKENWTRRRAAAERERKAKEKREQELVTASRRRSSAFLYQEANADHARSRSGSSVSRRRSGSLSYQEANAGHARIRSGSSYQEANAGYVHKQKRGSYNHQNCDDFNSSNLNSFKAQMGDDLAAELLSLASGSIDPQMLSPRSPKSRRRSPSRRDSLDLGPIEEKDLSRKGMKLLGHVLPTENARRSSGVPTPESHDGEEMFSPRRRPSSLKGPISPRRRPSGLKGPRTASPRSPRRGAGSGSPRVTSPRRRESIRSPRTTSPRRGDSGRITKGRKMLSRNSKKLRRGSGLPSLSKSVRNLNVDSWKHSAKRQAEKVFKALDQDNNGKLDRLEFKKFMKRTDMMEQAQHKSTRERSKLVRKYFEKADADGSKSISLDEFIVFYSKNFVNFYEFEESNDSNMPSVPRARSRKGSSLDSAHASSHFSSLIMTGNLKEIKKELDPEKYSTETLRRKLVCFAGMPAVVVAAHYDRLKIVEYLLSRRDLYDKLSVYETHTIIDACKHNDAGKVKRLLDSAYAHEVARSQLMDAFLQSDISEAQVHLKGQKHAQKTVDATRVITSATRAAMNLLNTRHSKLEDGKHTKNGRMVLDKSGTKTVSAKGNIVSEVHWHGVRKEDKPMLKAASRGDMLGVQEALVSADAEGGVHCMDNMRVTPLLHAVVTGNQKVVERLLLYKADVLHVDTMRRTALDIAASQDDHGMIVLLMNHGAGSLCKVKNSLGKVPLEVAKKEYTKEFLVAYQRAYKRYLIDHPELQVQEKGDEELQSANTAWGEQERRHSLSKKRHSKKIKKRESSGSKKIKKQRGSQKMTVEAVKAREALKFPLLNYHIYAEQWKVSVAAQIGDTDFLRATLEHEEQLMHQKDQFGMTPIMHAVANAQVEATRLLLKNTVDLDYMQKSGVLGNNPLHFAYDVGEASVLAMLQRTRFRRAEKLRNKKKKKPKDFQSFYSL